MSTHPNSPKLIKAGLILLDAETGAMQRAIALQYNPDSLTRTLQVSSTAAESGDRSQALRIKGPPVETIRLEAEIDATDQLEFPASNRNAVASGIHPQLAALETIVYPASADLLANNALAMAGTLEIVPMQALLTIFVWSRNRIVPVRITELSATEEAFDVALNPIRAKVTLGMRVLTVDDLGFNGKGGNLFMAYLRGKERLASMSTSVALSSLGVASVP